MAHPSKNTSEVNNFEQQQQQWNPGFANNRHTSQNPALPQVVAQPIAIRFGSSYLGSSLCASKNEGLQFRSRSPVSRARPFEEIVIDPGVLSEGFPSYPKSTDSNSSGYNTKP